MELARLMPLPSRRMDTDGQMAIQQKLQTRLAQKLILTPSLQQAIKLLPMSTLELADLLNQEVVENPLLEEVPTEDLQAAEAQTARRRKKRPPQQKTDTWDDQDYEYFFGEYLDDGYRPKRAAGSQASCRRSRTRCRRAARWPTTSAGSCPSRPTTTS